MAGIAALTQGLGQIIGRTVFLQTNTSNGIPVPLAVLDVVKNEDVEYTADVTKNPVEFGPEVTDHIQIKNPVVRLKGVMSATPLDMSIAVASVVAGGLAAFSSSQARSNLLNTGLSQGVGILGAALQGNASNIQAQAQAGALDAISRTILLTTFQNKTPFTVVTRRQRYSDMVIAKIRFPRDENTGASLAFEIDLEQVRIVSPLSVLKTVVDEKVISSASSSTNIGAQSTQQISDQMSNSIKSSPLGEAPGMSSKFSFFA